MLTIEEIDAALAGAASYGVQRVAFHNNGSHTATPGYFPTLLRNVGNHLSAAPEGSSIVVVSHAMGVDLLRKNTNIECGDSTDVLAKIDELRRSGVRFLVCRNTLRERSIDPSDLRGVTAGDFVRSGVAHLAFLQQNGFAYLHI